MLIESCCMDANIFLTASDHLLIRQDELVSAITQRQQDQRNGEERAKDESSNEDKEDDGISTSNYSDEEDRVDPLALDEVLTGGKRKRGYSRQRFENCGQCEQTTMF
jgi:hypothetical protein